MALDDSTIQQDVPSDTGETTDTLPPQDTLTPTTGAAPAPAPKTERELAMEAIEARHNERVARENGLDLQEISGDSVDDQLTAQTGMPDPDTPDEPATPSTAAPAPQKVKVKVDGVEAEVPLDEVVRNYQKSSSADRRLAEAARLQREAAELQAQLLAQHQQLQAQLTQTPSTAAGTPAAAPNSPEPPADVQEKGKAFLKALFEGDEETALQHLAAITAKGRETPQAPAIPDVSQLADQVAAHVQQKLQVDSALAQHRKDYPEIYADPDMEGFVLTKVNGVRRETGEDFFTALNQVSASLAQKFGWSAAETPGRAPGAAPTTTSTRAVKLERKASIDNVSSVNTKTGSTEAVPQTPSDVIAEMRAARLKG
jgi:hypothetical protein